MVMKKLLLVTADYVAGNASGDLCYFFHKKVTRVEITNEHVIRGSGFPLFLQVLKHWLDLLGR